MDTAMRNDEEIEIDLGAILHVLLGKIWIIIGSGLVCGIAVYLLSSFVLTKQYLSTAQLYIINRQNEGITTYSDIQLSTQLVKDYKILVTSRPVVEQVISNLNLDMKTEEFVKKVSVNVAADSRVLSIGVTNSNPDLAKLIVDNLSDVSSERICSVMQIGGVNIIEYGNLPEEPSSPDVMKYTVIGALLGIIAAAGLIVVIYILDDTIKTADDVEKYLGVSTLALIPLSEEEYDGVKSNKGKKRKR